MIFFSDLFKLVFFKYPNMIYFFHHLLNCLQVKSQEREEEEEEEEEGEHVEADDDGDSVNGDEDS